MRVAQSMKLRTATRSVGGQEIVADRVSDRLDDTDVFPERGSVGIIDQGRPHSRNTSAESRTRWKTVFFAASIFVAVRKTRIPNFCEARRSRTRGKVILIVSASRVAFLSRYFEIYSRKTKAGSSASTEDAYLCYHHFLEQENVYSYTFNTLTFTSTMKFHYADIVP